MRLIPAIDIIGGKCVRLTRGDYGSRKEYSQSPLEAARTFEENGLQYLHLVDLEGARSERIVNYRILETICSTTTLKVDFGGGVKSDEDVRIAFESGAAQVCAGSMAVKDPPMFKRWLSIYGSRKIILGADARDRMVATGGWAEA
jgi:phosphoribosylformimino-5-aminoimidazole carboxamide ribotide isomerase